METVICEICKKEFKGYILSHAEHLRDMHMTKHLHEKQKEKGIINED